MGYVNSGIYVNNKLLTFYDSNGVKTPINVSAVENTVVLGVGENTLTLDLAKVGKATTTTKLVKGLTVDEYGRVTAVETAEVEGGVGEETQSDWNVTEETDPAYIKNKPEIVAREYIDDAISAMSRVVATDDGSGIVTLTVSRSIHYVTFRNGATGEEYKMPVADGDDCADVVTRGLWQEPIKPSEEHYDYVYAGWGATDGGEVDDDILKNITGDKIVYAIFRAEPKLYTITWLDDDGTVLKSEDWAYNKVPSYTPTKAGYSFVKWSPTPVAVTGDASYTASWKEATGGNVILPETTITTAAGAYTSPVAKITNTSGIVPASSDKIKVTWNGASHTLECRNIYFVYPGGSTALTGFGNPYAIPKMIANVTEYRLNSDNGTIVENSGLEYFAIIGESRIEIYTASAVTATVYIEAV